MIFIALFLFIALIVIALNMYNSSNLEEIQQHIENQKCQNIIYSKGSYKALCEDKILEIANSFVIDFDKNTTMYYYKDINSLDIDTKKLELLINDNKRISFKNKDEVYKFYDELEKRINN